MFISKVCIIITMMMFFSSCSIVQEAVDSAKSGFNEQQGKTSNTRNSTSNVSYDQTKQQLLMRYVFDRNVEGVKKAVAMGANPNFGSNPKDVNYPLYKAIEHLHTDMLMGGRRGENVQPMIDFLRSKTNDLNACPHNSCILKKMCGYNLKECKKAIEVWGLDASNAEATDYMLSSKEDVLHYLLGKGMSTNTASTSRNPLSFAQKQSTETLRKLLDSGAQSRINEYIGRKSRGRFPLFNCVEANKIDNVKLLIEYGADVNFDCTGVLYEAMYKKYAPMVKLLLENGAQTSPACASNSRKSALQYALRNSSTEIVDLLVNHGAK